MQAKYKMIFSMTAFGTISLFVKNISISSGELALMRAIIAAFAIILFQVVSRKKMILSEIKKDLPILFASGVAMGFNWILFFQSYRYTTVSITTLTYCCAPVFVMAISPILFREKMTVKQVFCFIMATLGLVMIIGVSGMDQSRNNLIGILYGLGAASLYATVVILNKYVKRVTGIDRTLIQFLVSIVVLTPYVLSTTGIQIASLNQTGIINLLILGVFHTGLCYVLYFSSLKDLKGQQTAILSYIDPLVAILVSVVILGESISLLQMIGGMMILGFTLYNEINIKPNKMRYPVAEKS